MVLLLLTKKIPGLSALMVAFSMVLPTCGHGRICEGIYIYILYMILLYVWQHADSTCVEKRVFRSLKRMDGSSATMCNAFGVSGEGGEENVYRGLGVSKVIGA